jgi:cohesin loading factor subunit SCC2
VTNDTNRHIDISKKLVLQMLDEDDTVKDLAVKMIEQLWWSDI